MARRKKDYPAKQRLRRTKEQIEADLADVSRMYLQQMTQDAIAKEMTEMRGEKYTLRMVNQDVGKIKERWTVAVFENYNSYIHQELARIDDLESELWTALRKSSGGVVRQIVTQWSGKDGQVSDENAKKIVDYIEKSGVTPRFFDQIIEVQKERRRLLGLYADKAVTVTHEVKVKGYKSVSPGDWPDAINDRVVEGQIIN